MRPKRSIATVCLSGTLPDKLEAAAAAPGGTTGGERENGERRRCRTSATRRDRRQSELRIQSGERQRRWCGAASGGFSWPRGRRTGVPLTTSDDARP